MSINWLVTVPTTQGVDIPTYGNYGGPRYSDGYVLQPGEEPPLTTPPIDPLDSLFRQHDQAYDSLDPLVRARADIQLIRDIAALPDAALSAEGHLYAGATTLALIDQVVNLYGHPELFAPGERRALTENAYANLRKGNIDPELEEIAAAPELLENLLDYAGIGQIKIGDNGNNVLQGDAGNDVLIGLGGDDVLIGAAGNDYLWGDEGIDTAQYYGLFRGYTVSGTDSVSSAADGSDTLRSIEVLRFVDGRLATDVGDAAAIVYRIYDTAFNRAPDAIGFNTWIAALQNGGTAVTLAEGFINSPEFQARYGDLSNRGFVEQLYRNALSREGDEAGVAHWTNALDTGEMSRGQVMAGFSESAEHIEQLRPVVEAGLWDINEASASVARLYYAALDRTPDAGGAINWTTAIEGGASLADVADAFVFSPEFQGKYASLSNEQFVEHLYLNVLDRPADPAGLESWTNSLNTGQMDRADVVLGFSEAPEHQIKTVGLVDNGILFV
jgi:hypothetical protein